MPHSLGLSEHVSPVLGGPVWRKCHNGAPCPGPDRRRWSGARSKSTGGGEDLASGWRASFGGMSEAIVSPILAGNASDTDAGVIDDLIEDMAEPPAPGSRPRTAGVTKLSPPAMTRMLTNTVLVYSDWTVPICIAPADADRVSLRVWAASDTSTDFVRIADDPGKCNARSGSAILYSGQDITFTDPTHTGPLWVLAVDAVGPVRVSVVAVAR